ncbi:MAG TPA: NADH-quinone oxidoreductase subunit A [Verrucomicrobiota bacterium]|nr:NADH-quinone oxidoreductase subunit A [Verrucomicrobiota bacterium]HRZ38879.1 NADH-quinone oxidoreductase subunit A [Candidatus Paceibacterota bacterium]
MPSASNPYLFLALMLAAGLVFCLGMLGLARLWAVWVSPPKPGPTKGAAYECGLAPQGDVRIRFQSQYYLYAIIFLVFDVETVFLLPFAVSFTGLAPGAFVAIMVFLLLLVEGLVWAWGKGLLRWR